MNLFDDNYGHYEMAPDEDPEEVMDFYLATQKNSVRKRCQGCRQSVKIRQDYAYCNSCADKIEAGLEF